MERRRARALVQRALDVLDLKRRAVFVMHDFDGVAVPEIARTLGIPLNTTYSVLRLARRDFAAAVRRMSRPARSVPAQDVRVDGGGP